MKSKIFEKEFSSDPRIRHRTFGWDTTDGNCGVVIPFTEAGYLVTGAKLPRNFLILSSIKS